MSNPFQNRQPKIQDNSAIREPQLETYQSLLEFANDPNETDREVGIILPVGCGKSGCITLAPFAFRAKRALVVAPNVPIAQQLHNDFDPSQPDMFYKKCGVLEGMPYPELVEIRGENVNLADLEESHVVVTNIQQLQGASNRWLQTLPSDFFDVIIFDEGHHNVATSWSVLKEKFPNARIVNFSATPSRADGQIMAGRFLYTYPIFRAIQAGYVKRLKAFVLNPDTLRYVRREDGEEIEVDLEEVRRLGEEDADFRRSIVTSTETLNTIVDASIHKLYELRKQTGDKRLKIIASALNYEHCRQIVEAYRARSLSAAYIHSRENQPANTRVLQQLESHELDVIVQVRKLGEGFNHPYLAVAAVFSVFSNLSPFVQFVGRIMRVIVQNDASHPLNQGVVIFHAGANIAKRWEDFQEFSEADKDFFDQLLPMEGIDTTDLNTKEREYEPVPRGDENKVNVVQQATVQIQEIPLLKNRKYLEMIQEMREQGFTLGEICEAYEELEKIPVTKQRQRQAMRSSLDTQVGYETARVLQDQGINPGGYELDRQRLRRSNYITMKAAIDRQVNSFVGRSAGERSEFTRDELEQINKNFSQILARAIKEVFDAQT